MSSAEVWRPVAGLEGKYEVSSLGRIRSLACTGGIRKTPRIKKLTTDKDGYLGTTLCTGSAGKARTRRVHHVVLEAFTGPRPSGTEGAHLDGVPSNNKASNLKWATKSENEEHKKLHGTAYMGSKHYSTDLTETAVAEIKCLLRVGGRTHESIGSQFQVSKNVVSFISSGRTWKHVN